MTSIRLKPRGKYPWSQIAEGESVLLPDDKYDPDDARKAAYMWGRSRGVKLTSKKTPEGLLFTRAPADTTKERRPTT